MTMSVSMRVRIYAGAFVLSIALLAGAVAEEVVDAVEEAGQVEESVPEVFGAGVGLSPVRVFGGEESFADYLWDLPVIIDDSERRGIQEFQFIGRYHGQSAVVAASQGTYDSAETRRARLGVRMRFLEDFVFQTSFELGADDAGFDRDTVVDAWIAWRKREHLGWKVGQQKPLWSQEWSTSSNTLLTFERSLLVNQLLPPRSIGVYASGEIGAWAYGMGGFSGDVQSGTGPGAGSFVLLNVGHDFVRGADFFDEARWRLDYVWNGDADQAGGRTRYRHAVATGFSGKRGRWSVSSDVILAGGVDSVGEFYGFTVTPSYELIEGKLQLVTRFQVALSSKDALLLQDRYERRVGAGAGAAGLGDMRGEEYGAVYAGLNWFLRGHKLKLMAGVEYARMNDRANDGGDYDGWTILTGVRLHF